MIKTKRSAQDAVYDVLATLKDGIALTSKEIYSELEPADQGLFVGGVDGVMKSINKLHTRGIVVNGNSEIVNGRVVKTWRLRNEVSSHKPVVNAVAETVETETIKEEIKDKKEEREFVNQTNSVETLIEEAQNMAILSVASVFSGLIEQIQTVDFSQKPNPDTIDALVSGLFEVSDLLNEKISVKNIIPVIEFLRGLK